MTDTAAHLLAENLTAGHQGVAAFSGVDLNLAPGTIHGIIGPNGAGKSTLLSALGAMHPASSGTVRVAGHRLATLTAREKAHLRAHVPQGLDSESEYTVESFVALGRYAHRTRFSPLTGQDRGAIAQALDLTGVTHLARRQLQSLSGGQRQLVAIAKALAQEASFLLLDEPLSALDPRHQLEVLQVLRACAADSVGVAIVMHDLTLAGRLCHRLSVLAHGRIHASGRPEEVLTPKILAEVYGVEAVVNTDPNTGAPSVTLLAPLLTAAH